MPTAWFVDDDQEMTQAVRLMLKLIGYDMRAFLKVRDAVKILQYGDLPDVLLLDINLPEINGLDLLEYIRRNPDWQRIPIIMLSSETSAEEVKLAMNMGANAYLFKPVTLDELENAIREATLNVQR